MCLLGRASAGLRWFLHENWRCCSGEQIPDAVSLYPGYLLSSIFNQPTPIDVWAYQF